MSNDNKNDNKEILAIQKIHEVINWLAVQKNSGDINTIGIKINELSIWAANFAEQVGDAHEMMNNLEREYDLAVLRYVDEHGSTRGTGVKADRDARILYADKYKEYIEYKNLYKKLDLKLKSIDRIIDAHKQRVATLKQIELKNI